MKIIDLLVTDVMILDLKATTKQAAFEEMIDRLYDAGRITDKQAFMQGILAREAQTTTGLGDGMPCRMPKIVPLNCPQSCLPVLKRGSNTAPWTVSQYICYL